ncbi:MAG: FMN-binding protein [Candidatus Muiribacteriota bacterium]
MNAIKLGITLMLFCVVAAFSLAYVNSLTAPVITEYAIERKLEAKRELFFADKIDLTLFPDGEYEFKSENKILMRFKFENTAFTNIDFDSSYFELSAEEIREITKNIQIEQVIDFQTIPQKHNKFYNALYNAFMNEVVFESNKVIKDVFGKNLKTSPVSDDSGYINVPFRESMLYFEKDENNNKVYLKKIDDTYIEAIQAEGRVIFNDETIEEFNEQLKYDFFEYDSVKIGDNFLGYVLSASPQGYSSEINTIIGIDNDGVITGINIVSQQETPGLGAKCTEDWFQNQFEGLSAEQIYLKAENPQGKIDNITAATITAEAVSDGVRKTSKEFLEILSGGIK